MFSVSFRYKGDKRYRPYADGLHIDTLPSHVAHLACLACVRDIRIEEKVLPYKLYQI